MSTESGIPDFRSASGLYSQTGDIPPETILSHSYFIAHPAAFYTYHRRHIVHTNAQPNLAHTTLAKWEQQGLLGVITQNIDNLHQKAGSTQVAELHGSAYRYYCMDCHQVYPITCILGEGIPRCNCGGLIRPDVVLYEEALPRQAWRQAETWLAQAEVLLVGGTSLSVYPAAGLVREFARAGGTIAIVNQTETAMDGLAALVIRAPVGQVFAETDRLWNAAHP